MIIDGVNLSGELVVMRALDVEQVVEVFYLGQHNLRHKHLFLVKLLLHLVLAGGLVVAAFFLCGKGHVFDVADAAYGLLSVFFELEDGDGVS